MTGRGCKERNGLMKTPAVNHKCLVPISVLLTLSPAWALADDWTVSNTSCRVAGRSGSLYEIEMSGTITAHQTLQHLLVEGYVNDDFVGIDSSLDDMEPDDSQTFYISGYYSGEIVGATCGYEVTAVVTTSPSSSPDLVVDSPTVSDSNPAPGASFSLETRVRNQGDGASGATTLRLYRSTNATITSSDTELRSLSVAGLSAGGRTVLVELQFSAPSTAGTHYYGACVDAVPGESDTQNNCSAAVAVTVSAASAPGAPTGLTATADGQTRVNLTWDAPSDDGGSTISGYRIEVSTDGSSWSDLVADTDSTGTGYTHSGLTAGSARYYRVSAINGAGTGPASNVDSATTDSQANRAPTAVGTMPEQVLTAGQEVEVDVASYFSDPDADPLSYSVDSPQLFNRLSVSGSTVGMRWDGLLCEPRSVTVTARDPGGLEATQQFAVRRPNNPPVASSGTFPPQTLDVGDSSPLYMGNWFSDEDACDSRLTYSAESSDSTRVGVSVSGNIVNVFGVAAGNATVTVTASDLGNLEATLEIRATVISPSSEPGAPTGLTATADGQTRLDLTWKAPSSDGGSVITAYDLRYVRSDAPDKAGANWTVLQDVWTTGSGALAYELTGLTAGTQYDLQVRAVNGSGDGPWSATATGTPEAETQAEAATDFNGDGRTDFVDFFLFADAYGGSEAKFDLDGSGTVDFVDFFEFVDAFDQPGQAKLVALAREMLGLPAEVRLQQNAPNPFNNETVISWFLGEPGPARVEVFALNGQRVAVLRQGPQQAGRHRVHWDGRDDRGRALASGVYLYRLVTNEAVLTRKLTLLR